MCCGSLRGGCCLFAQEEGLCPRALLLKGPCRWQVLAAPELPLSYPSALGVLVACMWPLMPVHLSKQRSEPLHQLSQGQPCPVA